MWNVGDRIKWQVYSNVWTGTIVRIVPEDNQVYQKGDLIVNCDTGNSAVVSPNSAQKI